jgi:hypothetical protein
MEELAADGHEVSNILNNSGSRFSTAMWTGVLPLVPSYPKTELMRFLPQNDTLNLPIGQH